MLHNPFDPNTTAEDLINNIKKILSDADDIPISPPCEHCGCPLTFGDMRERQCPFCRKPL